jgi:hypothetical protein
MLFGQQLRLRLAKAHRPAAAAPLHPVHEIDPDADQQQEGQEADEQGREARLLLRLDLDRDAGIQQQGGQVGALGLHGLAAHSIVEPVKDLLAIDRDAGHLVILDLLYEVGIARVARRHGCGIVAEKLEQGDDQQKQDDPESDVAHIAHGGVLPQPGPKQAHPPR